jgi:hypothetical protein
VGPTCRTSPPSIVAGLADLRVRRPSARTTAATEAISPRRLVRPGAGQDREVVDDHDRVLDERAVRVLGAAGTGTIRCPSRRSRST